MGKDRFVLMRLAPEPFAKISSGQKTVEVRLYDDKRRELREGDIIRFCRVENDDEYVDARIIALHKFDSFSALFSSSLFPLTGFNGFTVSEATEYMYGFYMPENEKRCGVLGIELCLLH